MSLNCAEIDQCLAELDAEGAFIQGIVQPTWDTIVLELFKPGRPFRMFVSLAPGACRIHEAYRAFKKSERPQRFQELLKARVTGSRIASIRQVGKERIVRIGLQGKDEELVLWIKLWSNAANAILADSGGGIVDAAARRPRRGEISGGKFDPETDLAKQAGEKGPRPEKTFTLRELPGEGAFSRRIGEWYEKNEGSLSLEAVRERANARFAARMAKANHAIASLERKLADCDMAETWKRYGDILMANLHRRTEGASFAAPDFYSDNAEVSIRVDEKLDVRQNAASYYEKYKKAKSGREEVEAELRDHREALERMATEREKALSISDPWALIRLLARGAERKPIDAAKKPGLEFESRGYRILVGRNATENDELLRRHVKGNDTWLHTRDVPGGYVFVKAKAGKTLPLDVLVDAGNLAVFYSKARNSGAADLYYTQAKYLRRAKDGPKGLVLPTQEKNLRVTLDNERLRRLKPDGNG